MVIALRDWAMTSVWAIWTEGLLEKFIFFDSLGSPALSMSRLLGSCRKALKQLVEGEIPHVQPLLQNCFLQFLQIQDSAAFRRAKLIQRVMRMRASTEKQQILHVLSDWSQRALLTRQRKSFLSNEFDLVKEEVQQSYWVIENWCT
eukprot:g1102.t1